MTISDKVEGIDLADRLDVARRNLGAAADRLVGSDLDAIAQAASTIRSLNEECIASMAEIAAGRERAEAAEAQLQASQARVTELEEVLRQIADGRVGPERAAHYLAHRKAVSQARSALSTSSGEGGLGLSQSQPCADAQTRSHADQHSDGKGER